MTESNLTQKTQTFTIADGDLIYVLRDPGGTPLDTKMAYSDLKAKIAADNGIGIQIVATYELAVAAATGLNPIVFLVLASDQNSGNPTMYFYKGSGNLNWIASVGL